MVGVIVVGVIVVGVIVTCLGCGDNQGRVPVAGVVTLDGEPLPAVQVTFDQPDLGVNQNVGYLGFTDEQGRYALQPIAQEVKGVAPGEYRVVLTTAFANPYAASGGQPLVVEENPPTPPERIPPAYRGGQLSFTVHAKGTNAANFDLVSE